MGAASALPVLAATFLLTVAVSAQPAGAAVSMGEGPDADTGTAALRGGPEEGPRVPFRASTFYWDHSATTHTLGLGSDYQSRNPTYEMAFGFRPRWYFVDRRGESLSARADVALVRELTNSDVTTRVGEWTFTDAELWLAYVRTLNATPGSTTDLIVRAPQLVLPTSRVSASNGRILAVGAGLGVEQAVPLRGEGSGVFPGARLRADAGYRYHFTSSVVPTNDELGRVRLGPGGRSLPGDQLSGSAFPDHELVARLGVEPEIVRDLSLLAEIGARYAHRRALAEHVEVCGVIATGCATVDTDDDASRYGVSTLFTVELGYELMPELLLSVGYTNLAPQLGAAGRRRQPFYSQDARAYLTLTVALDELYVTAAGRPTHTAEAGQTASRRHEGETRNLAYMPTRPMRGERAARDAQRLPGKGP